MEIKTSLKELYAAFHQSASAEELPIPIRKFAAQLAVLTVHVDRVQAKLEGRTKALSAEIDELATHILSTKNGDPASTAAPTAIPAAVSPGDDITLSGLSEDEATEAMIAKVQQETEAEALAITNAPAPAAVTPLRKANAGGKKAPSAGGAA